MIIEFVVKAKQKLSVFFFVLLIGLICLTACSKNPSNISTDSPTTAQVTAQENIIRLANGNWPPYNGENLPHGGCDSWVIEDAFALKGITVDYEYFPWARSYNLSASGEFDGTLAWADTPEHRQQHYVSAEPTTIQEWVFFYRTDNPFKWNTLDDLEGKTVGITAGYVYSDAFSGLENDDKVTFIESSSDEANFDMLYAGRIDVFPMERRVGYYLIHSMFSADEQADLTNSEKSFAQLETHLLLSRAVPENAQRMVLFNQGLRELIDSGKYAEIMAQCES